MPINKFTGRYGFLSNFALCTIEYEGMTFPSVEHAFQAAKTFDLKKREEIRTSQSPSLAKRLGRKLKLRNDWEDVKEEVMLELLRIKFAQQPFRSKLFFTCDIQLIEGNTWGDTYWGKCRGIGRNRLGKLLMQVRDEIGR